MDPAALVDSFVAAYRPRVEARLTELGIGAIEGLDEAIETGRRWLREQLAALFDQPFAVQQRGPLELFQEAMSFPTSALSAAGIAPVERDEVAVAALPGDVYDLAPASSRQLGDEAWKAHLAWGAAKAAGVRTPVLPAFGVYTANLMDRSRFAVEGWRVITWRTAEDIDEVPTVAFVDLQTAGAERAISRLAAAGADVYAFGPHVDDLAMIRARTLGAKDAMARSVFFRRFAELLPKVI